MTTPNRLRPMAVPAALLALLFLCALLLNLHAQGWLQDEGVGMHLVVSADGAPPPPGGLLGSP